MPSCREQVCPRVGPLDPDQALGPWLRAEPLIRAGRKDNSAWHSQDLLRDEETQIEATS